MYSLNKNIKLFYDKEKSRTQTMTLNKNIKILYDKRKIKDSVNVYEAFGIEHKFDYNSVNI